MKLSDIDFLEESGIAQVRGAISHLRPNSRSFFDFTEILLQRFWISQHFTHIYDAGQDRLTPNADQARPTLRRIIREEYPNDRGAWTTPSHREDLVTDLLALGVTWDRFTASRPSRKTAFVIRQAKNMVYDSAQMDFSDVRLITFLRLWGEVLTAIEYEQLYPRIDKLLAGKPSVFYQHHLAHDARMIPLASILRSTSAITHADKLGKRLAALICDTTMQVEAVSASLDIGERVIKNKLAFYSQFV